MNLDDIVKKIRPDLPGLTYDQLLEEERLIVQQIAEAAQTRTLSVGDIQTHIQTMKGLVEDELTKPTMKNPSFWSFLFNFHKEENLRGRLRNYKLLDDLLSSPEKARKRADELLASMTARGGK